MNTKLACSISFAFLLFFCNQLLNAQSGVVESIFFKPGSYAIDKKYIPALNSLAKQAVSDSFIYVRIFAFTDTAGSEHYNDMLSEKRANAIYSYLSSRSRLDSTNCYVTWLGESNDIYDLHFPDVHAQQRCVDIWMTFYKRKK